MGHARRFVHRREDAASLLCAAEFVGRLYTHLELEWGEEAEIRKYVACIALSGSWIGLGWVATTTALSHSLLQGHNHVRQQGTNWKQMYLTQYPRAAKLIHYVLKIKIRYIVVVLENINR